MKSLPINFKYQVTPFALTSNNKLKNLALNFSQIEIVDYKD